MSAENHDALNMCHERCHLACRSLENIVDALLRIGMKQLSNEIQTYATAMDEVAGVIHTTTGKIIDDDLRDSQERSATMLKATLAGIVVGKEDK
jgi:hypothetical protein